MDPARTLSGVAAAALVFGIARRLFIGWDSPLWLDETFSAAIATRPDVGTLIARCLRELSGPVYYSLLWLWVQVAGASDFALRAPSIAFSIAAPLLILARGHPDRTTRLLWAGLTAVWIPALIYSAEARPYSLLLLLAFGQAIALAAHLRRPTTAAVLLWATLSALMILTHYHALVVSGLQGMLIVAHGRRAWRWSAVLPFAVAAAWVAFHLPTLRSFAAPTVAWYAPITPRDLLGLAARGTFGIDAIGFYMMAMIVVTTGWSFASPAMRPIRAAFPRSDVLVALSGLTAAGVVLALALLRPTFMPRYLLPFMPSMLLGVALWARAWNLRWPWFGTILLSFFMLVAAEETRLRIMTPEVDPHRSYSFEGASDYLAAAQPKRLIFLWDNPTAQLGARTMLGEVGGFFLARGGHPVPVETLIPQGRAIDPNRALLAAAHQPGDAILWLFDRSVHDTLGARHPPAIDRLDPRWACRDFGEGGISVIACTGPASSASDASAAVRRGAGTF